MLVDLFTGGASCCVLSVIYGYAPLDNAYIRRVMDFGSGYRLRDFRGDGLEFHGADYRFKYLFSCGACSPQPSRIWRYRDFKLVDVSRRFPGLLRREAKQMYRLYQRVRRRRDPLLVKGVLPAYVADMCRIQRRVRAFRVVRRARPARQIRHPAIR